MNDNELDRLLYKSLKPQVTEDEIRFLGAKEDNKHMNITRIYKPLIALAACAALIVGAIYASGGSSVVTPDSNSNSVASTNVIDKVANSFALKVVAADKSKNELKKDLLIAGRLGNGGVWSEGDNGSISYDEDFPIICEGSNIEKITYSINKGAFQIIHGKNDGFIVEGDKLDNELNVGSLSPKSWTAKEKDAAPGDSKSDHYDRGFYTSYTVKPELQESDDISVCICNDITIPESTNKKVWAWSYEPYSSMLRDDQGMFTKDNAWKCENTVAEGRNEIYDNLKITCTVTYKDKSTETRTILVKACAMTSEEAGFDYTDKEEYKDYPNVYTCYSVE